MTAVVVRSYSRMMDHTSLEQNTGSPGARRSIMALAACSFAGLRYALMKAITMPSAPIARARVTAASMLSSSTGWSTVPSARMRSLTGITRSFDTRGSGRLERRS